MVSGGLKRFSHFFCVSLSLCAMGVGQSPLADRAHVALACATLAEHCESRQIPQIAKLPCTVRQHAWSNIGDTSRHGFWLGLEPAAQRVDVPRPRVLALHLASLPRHLRAFPDRRRVRQANGEMAVFAGRV